MNHIYQLTKLHKEFIQTVRGFGEENYAEDIVQEMYIKLSRYKKPEILIVNGIVNRAFIYCVLRSLYFDYCKSKNKVYKVQLNEVVLSEDMRDKNEQESLQKIQDKINAEINSWHWYDKMLFNLYRNSGMSIRKLSKETKISTSSIFNTIKYCKARLRAAVSEDYWDVLHEDYELIK